jgi:hypothetical protein
MHHHRCLQAIPLHQQHRHHHHRHHRYRRHHEKKEVAEEEGEAKVPVVFSSPMRIMPKKVIARRMRKQRRGFILTR